MKAILVFLFSFTLLSLTYAQQKQVTLVIDAGHGGDDPGHLSQFKGIPTEKDLNLKIALYLGEYIEKYLGNVKVIYTRKTDKNKTLNQRVEIANAGNVDYFLSIHCNGVENSSVHGTESHVHDFSAKKSYSLAKEIENQFANRAGRSSRGVKNNDDRSHSIQVLKYTKMTSVLVECGFMTNRSEANVLNSNYGQEVIASAIFRAFRKRIKSDYPKIDFSVSDKNAAYRIQIMSSKGPVELSHSSFKRLEDDVERQKLNTKSAYKFRYLVGGYSTKNEADKALIKVQTQGFPDAIVIKNE
ncbi:MAG: N-acetylmuramoyl-L-alanine amidase [Lentimonas sp.]|jgi:N-acetylmuramoyl-L-alanine amidase